MVSELRVKAILSAQRALLGDVKPYVRAISLDVTKSLLKLWVFHDGPVPLEDIENFDAVVVAQMVADFPDPDKSDPSCEFEFVRIDQPGKIDPRGEFIFYRWEAESNEGI